MPILTTDLIEYKSLNANSDGGAIDTSRPITTGVLDNLWDDITGAEAAAGGIDYRKVFRKNTNGSLSWLAAVTWIRQQPSGATEWIGVGVNDAADADALQGNIVAMTANAQIALVSDGADTRVVHVEGLDTGGHYLLDAVTLTGTSPVLTADTFSSVLRVYAASTDGSRTITVQQGSGGPTLGTIGPTKIVAWMWVQPLTQATGIQSGDIAPAGLIGLWLKRVWSPGSAAVSGTGDIIDTAGQTLP